MNRWYMRTWSRCEWWINHLSALGTYLRYEVDMRPGVTYPYVIVTTSRNAVYMGDRDNYPCYLP